MIRRTLIITGIVTALLGGLCLLSYVWQFGYVSSWGTLGMREGKLWYLWRSASIPDAIGLYVDEASAVNRALYNVNQHARWSDEPLWPWVLGIPAAVGCVIALVVVRRMWHRGLPRWLVVTLVATFVLSAGVWTASQFLTLEYNGPGTRFHVSQGTVSLYAGQLPTWPAMPWQPGWTLHRYPPGLRMDLGTWFGGFSSGTIIVNLPIGLPAIVVLVPLLVLSRKRVAAGHCVKCDYDLTGNESGVCPECGAAVSQGAMLQR